jgi:hypothetical protein
MQNPEGNLCVEIRPDWRPTSSKEDSTEDSDSYGALKEATAFKEFCESNGQPIPRLLFGGAKLIGMISSEAMPGDVILHYNGPHDNFALVVRREHKSIFSIVGQAVLIHRVDLVPDQNNFEVHWAAEDLLILLCQDPRSYPRFGPFDSWEYGIMVRQEKYDSNFEGNPPRVLNTVCCRWLSSYAVEKV